MKIIIIIIIIRQLASPGPTVSGAWACSLEVHVSR
jgi:hypothetical protein